MFSKSVYKLGILARISSPLLSAVFLCLSPLRSGHTESLCSAMRMCPGRSFPVRVLVSSHAQACFVTPFQEGLLLVAQPSESASGTDVLF